MIKVIVKTLDAQNHEFEVDDNMTVAEFKEFIAERVNISADRQRIIYCGRVLQDSITLANYDLDDKVVHLVQRAPPSTSDRLPNTPPLPNESNRPRSGFARVGNTVFMGMGSMPLPQGIIDTSQMIPSRTTHNLSSSRLNVARRMLRNAEHIIRLLENPNVHQTQPEATPDEEMTPIIEARVLIPSTGDQTIDGNAIFTEVQNQMLNADGARRSTNSRTNNEEQATSSRFSNANQENNTSNGETNRSTSRGPDMAALLTTLNELQTRLSPFLSQFQAFAENDPVVLQENLVTTRLMINRVSQVLHFLGHAYHSLSDIIIDVDQPPPRLLLCRPILIQPSNVMQTGIPVQVEAQINLTADLPRSTSTRTDSAPGNPTTTAPRMEATFDNTATPIRVAVFDGPLEIDRGLGININSTSSTTASQITNNSSPRVSISPLRVAHTIQTMSRPSPNSFMVSDSFSISPRATGSNQSFPNVLPGATMHVIHAPMDINIDPSRTTVRNSNTFTHGATNGNSDQPTNRPNPNIQTSASANATNTRIPHVHPNQHGMEFSVEVTPESLRSGNIIESIMQIVSSQLGETLNQTLRSEAPSQQPQTVNPSNQQEATPTTPLQARSTQTNPTTATRTRASPRPHVQMTQQVVQGGFDPFLHCFSHHIGNTRPRIVHLGSQVGRSEQTNRSVDSTQNGAIPHQQTRNTQETDNRQPIVPPILSYIQQLLSTLHPQVIPRTNRSVDNATAQTSQGRGADEASFLSDTNDDESEVVSFISRLVEEALPDSQGQEPTLDVYIQSLRNEPHVRGENLILDLVMLIFSNMRFNDLVLLCVGNHSPILRNIHVIRRFVLEYILRPHQNGSVSSATDRLINDFSPITREFQAIPARDDIDISRTIECFLRSRIPLVLEHILNSGIEGNTETATSEMIRTIWDSIKSFLALLMNICQDGRESIEHVLDQILIRPLLNRNNLSMEMQQWTLDRSRLALTLLMELRNMLRDIRMNNSFNIDQYTVRREAEAESTLANQEVPVQPVDHITEAIDIDTDENSSTRVMPDGSDEDDGDLEVETTTEEWTPTISRDVKRQRTQNAQPVFSDGYLSGMSSKKRKLLNSSKPPDNLSQVMSESIRQVITSFDSSGAVPVDELIQTADESVEIQEAYRTLLQRTVQDNLRDNEDFSPERYPNVQRHFNEPSD